MKKWYTSKVVWVNVITILTVIASFVGVVPNQQLAEKWSPILVALSPILNLLMRLFITKKPIAPVV